MFIANSALRASLAIYHLISNKRSWNNCTSWYNLLLATFVVFISTVKFRINAMYMGGVPMAEHCTLLPGTNSTAAKTLLGGTSKAMFEFS